MPGVCCLRHFCAMLIQIEHNFGQICCISNRWMGIDWLRYTDALQCFAKFIFTRNIFLWIKSWIKYIKWFVFFFCFFLLILKILTSKILRASTHAFRQSGGFMRWRWQSFRKKNAKSQRVQVTNEVLRTIAFRATKSVKFNWYSVLIVCNHLTNLWWTVGKFSCRLIRSCVIPVKFMQYSLRMGWFVGRT